MILYDIVIFVLNLCMCFSPYINNDINNGNDNDDVGGGDYCDDDGDGCGQHHLLKSLQLTSLSSCINNAWGSASVEYKLITMTS